MDIPQAIRVLTRIRDDSTTPMNTAADIDQVLVECLDVISDEQDESLLVQCTERERGGVQCEVMLISPDQPHFHWISDKTIRGQ